jgi:hypothetical protein
MPNDDLNVILNDKGRDAALIWALTELRTLRTLTSTMLAVMMNWDDARTREWLNASDREELLKVMKVLGKQSEVPPDELLKRYRPPDL